MKTGQLLGFVIAIAICCIVLKYVYLGLTIFRPRKEGQSLASPIFNKVAFSSDRSCRAHHKKDRDGDHNHDKHHHKHNEEHHDFHLHVPARNITNTSNTTSDLPSQLHPVFWTCTCDGLFRGHFVPMSDVGKNSNTCELACASGFPLSEKSNNIGAYLANEPSIIMKGYARMAQKTVVICMIARNKNSRFEALRRTTMKLAQHFKQVTVIVVENDSDDGLSENLKKWETELKSRRQQRPHTGNTASVHKQPLIEVRSVYFKFKMRKTLDRESEDRTQLYSLMRNQYLVEAARVHADYLFVMDLDEDLAIEDLSIDGIAHSFGVQDHSTLHWNGVCANGVTARSSKDYRNLMRIHNFYHRLGECLLLFVGSSNKSRKSFLFNSSEYPEHVCPASVDEDSWRINLDPNLVPSLTDSRREVAKINFTVKQSPQRIDVIKSEQLSLDRKQGWNFDLKILCCLPGVDMNPDALNGQTMYLRGGSNRACYKVVLGQSVHQTDGAQKDVDCQNANYVFSLGTYSHTSQGTPPMQHFVQGSRGPSVGGRFRESTIRVYASTTADETSIDIAEERTCFYAIKVTIPKSSVHSSNPAPGSLASTPAKVGPKSASSNALVTVLARNSSCEDKGLCWNIKSEAECSSIAASACIGTTDMGHSDVFYLKRPPGCFLYEGNHRKFNLDLSSKKPLQLMAPICLCDKYAPEFTRLTETKRKGAKLSCGQDATTDRVSECYSENASAACNSACNAELLGSAGRIKPVNLHDWTIRDSYAYRDFSVLKFQPAWEKDFQNFSGHSTWEIEESIRVSQDMRGAWQSVAVLPYDPPRFVDSCFGGFAIYDLHSPTPENTHWLECGYAADQDNNDCEHVSFHRCLKSTLGWKVMINPRMVIRYKY